jgi:hypothetical protein
MNYLRIANAKQCFQIFDFVAKYVFQVIQLHLHPLKGSKSDNFNIPREFTLACSFFLNENEASG